MAYGCKSERYFSLTHCRFHGLTYVLKKDKLSTQIDDKFFKIAFEISTLIKIRTQQMNVL